MPSVLQAGGGGGIKLHTLLQGPMCLALVEGGFVSILWPPKHAFEVTQSKDPPLESWLLVIAPYVLVILFWRVIALTRLLFVTIIVYDCVHVPVYCIQTNTLVSYTFIHLESWSRAWNPGTPWLVNKWQSMDTITHLIPYNSLPASQPCLSSLTVITKCIIDSDRMSLMY